MQYRTYLQQGYLIGSGPIESAHRHDFTFHEGLLCVIDGSKGIRKALDGDDHPSNAGHRKIADFIDSLVVANQKQQNLIN